MKRSGSDAITCRWVPGTLDLVRIEHPYGIDAVPLHDVRLVLGRACVQDLYLIGRHVVTFDETTSRDVLRRLGCLVPASPTRSTRRRVALGQIAGDRGGFD